MSKYKLVSTIIPVILLLLLAAAACSEASPAFGKPYRGRTLDVTIVTLDRVPELRYATIDTDQVTRHYRIAPSSDELELVLLRLKVANHTATSAIVNIDSQATELRDFFRGSYRPININDRVEEVSAPENPGEERSIVFLWNRTAEDGTTEAFELKKNFGLDGWMVFEGPKDSKFRELRWRAGDSLTITF